MKTKNQNLFFSILSALILFVCTNVNAQSVPNHLRFGIGVEGLLPVGNAGTSLNPGLGITPRLQYGLSDKLALTFTSGLYHFFPKTITIPATMYTTAVTYRNKSDVIPVKIGAKYFVSSNFYVAGEVGASFEVADGGGPVSFLYSPGIGYATKKWDVAARFESFSGHYYSDGIVGLRVAYGFGL